MVELTPSTGLRISSLLPRTARNASGSDLPANIRGRSVSASAFPYNEDMVDWYEHLSRDPQICGGELCVKGTRIPVAVILDGLGEGSTVEEILASNPSLRREHIQASLAYAAE